MSVPCVSVLIGPQSWKDETLRTIQKAGRLVQRAQESTSKIPDLAIQAQIVSAKPRDDGLKSRPKTPGDTLQSVGVSNSFPPSVLREKCIGLSTGIATEYKRDVREIENRLRRQAVKMSEEANRLGLQKVKLEKLLQDIRTALNINQKTIDERTRRPGTETEKDGADQLICHERKSLIDLKQNLEALLRDTLTQLQNLAQSKRQLLDCAFERARVTDLLPQHGSLSSAVRFSVSALSLKPDPSSAFTSECKEALESSAGVLQISEEFCRIIEKSIYDTVVYMAALNHSVNQGLLQKIAETQNLQKHLILSSAATRQAIYRKQNQVYSASLSQSRALGPCSSADLSCKEKLNRPVVQIYERHPSLQLPQSRLLTQGCNVLKQYLESTKQGVKELKDAHLQLEDDSCAKGVAASVDSSTVRFRRKHIPRKFVQSESTSN